MALATTLALLVKNRFFMIAETIFENEKREKVK